MGSNPTFSAKIKTIHPDGLYFLPKVGFERRLLETCQWHVSTAVGARRPTTSKIFNGCLPQQMEAHRPDLSARSIRRERRLLETCQWHVSTAVGARRPTTSKIFNGCLPQQMEAHRPDLSARSIRRERRLLETCQWHVSTAVGARRPTTSKIFNGCFPQKRNPTFSAGRAGGIRTHLKNFPQSTKFFSAQQIFYHVNHRKSREKVRYFTDFTDNSRCLKISQIFSQFLLTKGDTPAIIYLVAERQAVHRERSMRVCWNW